MDRKDMYWDHFYTCLAGIVIFFWMAQPWLLGAWIFGCFLHAAIHASDAPESVDRDGQDAYFVKQHLKDVKGGEMFDFENGWYVNNCQVESYTGMTEKEAKWFDLKRTKANSSRFVLCERNKDLLVRMFSIENLTPEQLKDLKKKQIVQNVLTQEEKEMILYPDWYDRKYFYIEEVFDTASAGQGSYSYTDGSGLNVGDVRLSGDKVKTYINRAFNYVNGCPLFEKGEK